MSIATINGVRLLLTGGADGAALAMKPQTGEPVWNLVIAKRGLNTGLVVNGNTAIVSHSEENLDSNEMGMIAAFDATGKGKLGKESIKWAIKGFMGGFASATLDGDRIYQADNGGGLHAFDPEGIFNPGVKVPSGNLPALPRVPWRQRAPRPRTAPFSQ
jgi:hypothetical protein